VLQALFLIKFWYKNFARASATVLTRWGFGSCCQLVLQHVSLVQLAWPCFDGVKGGATSHRDQSNKIESSQIFAAALENVQLSQS
jgi:hypothetical protein